MSIDAYPSVSDYKGGVTIMPGTAEKRAGRWVTISIWELGQYRPRGRVVPYGSDEHITALAAIYKARATVPESVGLNLKILNGPHAGEVWEVGAGAMNSIEMWGEQIDV